MGQDRTETTDTALLRRQSALASKLWGRAFSALTLAALRETDAATLTRLWFDLTHAHQAESYVAGLRKLGIDREPPAIAAAKYHYFSNAIGGLAMEYVEESPRKVWIRYVAPSWTYAGTALAGLPRGVRRFGTFASWHPFNGALMGCPRLGWVLTKLMDEGEACDEGYFIEHDRDLAPEERMRYEVAPRTPEFDPAKAPQLDPLQWPEPRLLKARRGYARSYVDETVKTLAAILGPNRASDITAQAMRAVAIQYTHELAVDLGIAGKSFADICAFITGVLSASGQPFAATKRDGKNFVLTLDGLLPFRHPGEELRMAYFQFFVMAVRILNGRIRVARTAESETWRIEDTGRWLW
jgi:hypothetical protein